MRLIAVLLGALLTFGAAYGFGWLLTRRHLIHPAIRLAVGTAALSTFVFGLLSMGWAHRPQLLCLSVVACAVAVLGRPSWPRPGVPLWAVVPLCAFGAYYAVNALAPEVQMDANTYHLSPAVEARRTGSLSSEVSFYNQMPHATELLYVPAYAIGGASSAKLVHFGFLLASLPLILLIGRRLDLNPSVSWSAALVYFTTPVVGTAGTAAFNDAALVFATLAVIAALLDDLPPWIAGLCAGLCYAIKMTGGLAVVVGLILLALRRRWRQTLPFTFSAGIIIAPWLLQNLIQTGNPFAPFFNRLFPNRYFTATMEHQLNESLSTYGIHWSQRVPELLWGDELQGILGPCFILAPLALLALRNKAQRPALIAACVFTIPWLLNAGARFVMPALPFLALLFLAQLPQRMAIGVVVLHAVTAWPTVIGLYAPQTWRLDHFPLAAGLRIESEHDYLARTTWNYRVARMIEQHTKPTDRLLDLHGVYAAYVDRQFRGWWRSPPAQRSFEALSLAYLPGKEGLYRQTAMFPLQAVRAVRVRQTNTASGPWSLCEVELFQNTIRLATRRSWLLSGDPNPWQTPLAFDRNPASRWITDGTARPGMQLTLELDSAESVSEVRVTATRRDGGTGFQVDIQRNNGTWFTPAAAVTEVAGVDLRPYAVHAAKREGFTHIVAHAGYDGPGQLGYRLANDAPHWGIEVAASMDNAYLFRLR